MAKKKTTTMRTGKQARQDKTRKGKSAVAGKTKSLLQVLQDTGLRPPTTIRSGGRRNRGGIQAANRAMSQMNSLSR